MYNTVFRILAQLAGAVAYVLLVRLLSEEDFGQYQLFYAIPSVISTLLSLGLANTLIRYLPEYFNEKRFGLARRLVTWCLRLRFVVTLLSLAAIYLLWDLLAPVFKIQDQREQFLIFAAIVVAMFQARILATAVSTFLLQQWSIGAAALLAVAKTIGYATALQSGLTLTTAFLIDLVANLLFYAVVRFAYNRRIPKPSTSDVSRFEPKEKRRLFRYALFYNFNDAGSLALMARADYLFIAGFMTPTAVGVYAFCTELDGLIKKILPMHFFFGVIQPVMFTVDYKKEKAKAIRYFQFLTKLTYLVQIPIFIFIASVPAAMIDVLFAGKFAEYTLVLISVFAFSTLTAVQEPIFLVAQLEEKAGIVMASKVFALYNIGANLLLIPSYGVMGAVVATGTSVIFKCLFVWFFVRGIASFAGMGGFFLRQLALWGCCWGLIRLATEDLGSFASFFLAILAHLAFTLLSVRLAGFASEERRLIRDVAGGRFPLALRLLGITS